MKYDISRLCLRIFSVLINTNLKRIDFERKSQYVTSIVLELIPLSKQISCLRYSRKILCIMHQTFQGTCDILFVFVGDFLLKTQVCYSCNKQRIHDSKLYYINQTSYCSLTPCIRIVHQRLMNLGQHIFLKMCCHSIIIFIGDRKI